MKLLGDVHLGKRFIHGVPLHRRGERERLIREEFLRRLDPQGESLHVMLGDLFDAPDVGYETLMFACAAYGQAVHRHPETRFIVLRGNHDDSRDITEVTAFDVFGEMMTDRVLVVSDWAQIDGMVLFGWSPDRTAEQVVAEARFENCAAAFGHWDVDPRSPPHNLLPSRLLAERGIASAYTGHVHLPDRFERHRVNVIVVGSMVPLAHGEDPTGDWYVTLTRQQFDEADPASLRQKCVRVVLAPGDAGDVDLDCLQLKVERAETLSMMKGSPSPWRASTSPRPMPRCSAPT